jgi:hypothetical protein
MIGICSLASSTSNSSATTFLLLVLFKFNFARLSTLTLKSKLGEMTLDEDCVKKFSVFVKSKAMKLVAIIVIDMNVI